MKPPSARNAPAEWIALIDHQIGFRSHESRALDEWNDLAIDDLDVPFERAAGDALLDPQFVGFELSIGIEAGHLCAGARAAGRAVIAPAGAQDEVAAVGR